MKKILIFITSLLLLTSCISTRESSVLTIEEKNEITNSLISAIKTALVNTENSLFASVDDFTFDSSYTVYLKELPQFRRTANSYLENVAALLREALKPVTDYMITYVDGFYIMDPEPYLDGGYSSISTELERRLYNKTYSLFLSYITKNSSALDEVYASLQYEADIWRGNNANLSKVGVGRIIDNIKIVSFESIAEYATRSYFKALGEAEVVARTKLEASSYEGR